MPGPKLRPTAEDGKTAEAAWLDPTRIQVDHTRNVRRAFYPVPDELKQFVRRRGRDRGLANKAFCFTLAQVEERMEDLVAVGQVTPITYYMTKQLVPHLRSGHLRHAAFLLALARGIDIPGGPMMSAHRVPEPSGHEGWESAWMAGASENKSLPPSAIDLAWIAKRYTDPKPGGFGWTRAKAASAMRISKPQLDKLLRLLGLHPDVQLAVHEGRVKMAAALGQASANGEIGTGPRRHVSVSRLRRALKSGIDSAPEYGLNPSEIIELLQAYAGSTNSEPSDWARAWIEWSQPED